MTFDAAPCGGYLRRMVHGLYRTRDRLLGVCVRVSWSAGDAAPILTREIYEAMGGHPPYAELPSQAEYRRRHDGPAPDPFELP